MHSKSGYATLILDRVALMQGKGLKLVEETNWFGKQTEFILKVKLHQLRKLGGQDKSRWLETKSKQFCLADKFVKESTDDATKTQP